MYSQLKVIKKGIFVLARGISISQVKTIQYLYSLHVLSIILLAFFTLSLGMSPAIIIIGACEIAIFLFARGNQRLFYFIWQVTFFFVFLLGAALSPEKLFNDHSVPALAQPLFIIILVALESAIVALYLFGERPIKSILFGSTAIMIITVLLIIALIGSEGLRGFAENDPFQMMTSTDWAADYEPGMTSVVNISTIVSPYSYDTRVNNAIIHAQPDATRTINLTITNTGALNDTYTISLDADDEVVTSLPESSLEIPSGKGGTVLFTVCSEFEGIHDVLVRVESFAGMTTKDVEIKMVVSDIGVDFEDDHQDVFVTGTESSKGSYVMNLTNIGVNGANITFKINASNNFRPSVSGTSSWDYSLNEGYAYLGPGETLSYYLVPRLVKATSGIYTIDVTATINGTGISDKFTLLLDYDSSRIGRSVNPWPLPLSADVTTEWPIVLESMTYSRLYVKVTDLPPDCSVAAYLNGVEVPIRDEWIEVNLTKDAVMLTLHASTTDEVVDHPSLIALSVSSVATNVSFGMGAFLLGTAITVILALVMAVPLALGSAIFLSEYAPSRLRRIMKPIMEVLAGIPSVVYGLWGALTLGPLLITFAYPLVGDTVGVIIPFFDGNGNYTARSIMTASIVLAVMIFPIIMTLSYDSFRVVPSELKDASLATGASKWQTIRKVMMVKARSGIIASIVLGMGRAIGETMAVLMIMGCISKIPANAYDTVGTMTSVIASQFASTYAYETTRHGLFAVALTLFIIVFILNLVVIELTKENAGDGRISKAAKLVKRKLLSFIPSKESGTKRLQDLFRSSARGEMYSNMAKWALFVCAAVLIVVVAFIVGNVVVKGGSSFDLSLLTEVERGGGAEGGFLNAFTGSLAMVAIAIGGATPISVFSAIYISEYAKQDSMIARLASLTTTTLASTPSIIYGVFGFMLFVSYLSFGLSMLAGGLTLAIMAMPLIFVSTYEGLKSVPSNLREASYALGVSRWSTIRNVVLPVSLAATSSGVIIAVGRTIGETAAVMLTAGYATVVSDSVFMPAASVPNMIYQYYDTSSKIPNIGEKLFAASFLLVVVIILLNFAARYVAYRSQKRMGISLDKM